MAALPFPASDPVWGKQGALLHLWRLRERRCGPLPKRLGWKSGRIHAYALLSEIRDQAVAGDVANPIPTLPSRKSSQSLVALQRFAGGDETSVLFYLLCLTHGDLSPLIGKRWAKSDGSICSNRGHPLHSSLRPQRPGGSAHQIILGNQAIHA